MLCGLIVLNWLDLLILCLNYIRYKVSSMGQLSFSDVKGAQLFSYFIVETFFLISIYYPDVSFLIGLLRNCIMIPAVQLF